jgi:hypothetical protein
MGKVWVLDTETKGTGAQMVPLDKVLERKRSAPGGDGVSVIRRGRDSRSPETADAGEASEPRGPRLFKVVNSTTRQVLAEGVEMSDALEALGRLRSVVDATVYVRRGIAGKWIPLTIGEQKSLWELRGRRE